MEIQNEIDKLLTLKESFSKIANSYSSLIPKEFVTIQLHVENTDLSAYKIKVVNTTSGNEEFYDISASGYTEFEVKYDSVYEIVFPIIGAYITPATRTFTAQKPIRKIEASYVMAGVFGLDEQGNRYSLEQIEALEDKSIIKYGGYTDSYLENYIKSNGDTGCGIMWDLDYAIVGKAWASRDVEFDTNLLPFLTDSTTAANYCDGEAYTNYMLSEAARLGVTSDLAEFCSSSEVLINGEKYRGIVISSGQYQRLYANLQLFKDLYNMLGKTIPAIGQDIFVSAQYSSTDAVRYRNGTLMSRIKTIAYYAFVCYPLPKK